MRGIFTLSTIALLAFTRAQAVVCSGGTITYNYTQLLSCSGFDAVTDDTNIIIEGPDITTLEPLFNLTLTNWLGIITISNTSLTALTGLDLPAFVAQLNVIGNAQLLSLDLPISYFTGLVIEHNAVLSSINSTAISGTSIIIQDNPALNELNFNDLSGVMTSITINRTGLDSLESFNQITTLNSLSLGLSRINGFNGLNQVITTMYLTQLFNITGFQTLVYVGTMTISQSTVTSLSALQIRTAMSIILNDLTQLIDLRGLQHLTTINNLQIIGANNLLDYSAISGFQAVPSTFSSTDSCCPAYNFYNNILTIGVFTGCIDCVQLTSLTPMLTPTVGGVFVNITYDGPIQLSPVMVNFGTQIVSCPVSYTTNIISCLTPSNSLGPINIGFSINNHPRHNSNLIINYVDLETYRGSVILNPQVIDSTIGGTIIEQTNYINGVVKSMIIAMAIVVFLIVLIFTLISKRHPLICSECYWLIKLDFLYAYETTIDNSLKRYRTPLGGLMIIIYFIVTFFLLAALTFQSYRDNLQNNISYIPNIISTPTLSTYSGNITMYGLKYSCTGEIVSITITGVVGPTVVNYNGDNTSCHLGFSCNNCTLLGDSASFTVMVNDPNAFSLGFDWSWSSLDQFGLISMVSGTTEAGIYKGLAGQIVLTNIPINYIDASGNNLNGVLTRYVNQELGPTMNNFSIAEGVGFSIKSLVNADTLQLLILIKQSDITIVTQCLAIISGVYSMVTLIIRIYYFLFPYKPVLKISSSPSITLPSTGSIEMI